MISLKLKKNFPTKMIKEMITTPRMVFWCFSIVLPVHVTYLYSRQSVCLLCFECIDGLPLDLVTHNYRHSLARHETEATACGKLLCRRAKILERTRQSPYYNIIASNAHVCVWLSPHKKSKQPCWSEPMPLVVRAREIMRALRFLQC